MKKILSKFSMGISLLLTILLFPLLSLDKFNVLIQIVTGGAIAFILSFSIEMLLIFISKNKDNN